MKPEIMTVSGKYFNFDNPEDSDFTIEDIAYALSNICRFTGHTKKYYSVGQHSVLVSYIVAPENALAGLLHDSSEAFLGDVSSPLKQLVPEYKIIETKVEQAIFSKFGVPFPMHTDIKRADLIMLASEMKSLMPKTSKLPQGVIPLKAEIKPWQPAKARRKFLDRFYELTGE